MHVKHVMHVTRAGGQSIMRSRTLLSVLAVPCLASCSSTERPLLSEQGVASAALVAAMRGDRHDDDRIDSRHVLLISIDGLHQVDLQKFITSHPASALAELAHHGIQ